MGKNLNRLIYQDTARFVFPEADKMTPQQELLLEVYDKNFGLIVHFLIKDFGCSRPDAEYAIQETIIKIFDKVQKRSKGEILRYLITCSGNTCIDLHRKKKSRNRRRDKELGYSSIDVVTANSVEDQLIDQEKESEDSSIFEENVNFLQEALDLLGDRQRIVITERWLKGKTLNEISQELGISLSAIKSLHHRAKLELFKKILEIKKSKIY